MGFIVVVHTSDVQAKRLRLRSTTPAIITTTTEKVTEEPPARDVAEATQNGGDSTLARKWN